MRARARFGIGLFAAALAVGALLAPPAGAAKAKARPAEEVVQIYVHPRKSEFEHVLIAQLYPLQGVATVSTRRSGIEFENDRAVNYAVAIPRGPFDGFVDLRVPGLGKVVGQVTTGEAERGEKAPKGCDGRAGTSEVGTFGGTIDIKGAGGLGRWRDNEGKAWVRRSPERHCGPGADRDRRRPGDLFSYFGEMGPILPGPDDYWLAAHRATRHRETIWDAMGRGGRLFLAAIDFEWLPGEVAVERWVTQDGKSLDKGGLVAGPGRPHPASAVVRGTAPFVGTARFSRKGRALNGSLRAHFPGITVPLTGHGWKASFYDYDVER